MMSRLPTALGALLAVAISGAAQAEPTQIVVRAISKDAKFIGDSMGGARVTLTDARSGRELASGLISGGTGDTGRIIVAPRVRGAALSTPEAAAFRATLDLDHPTLVKAQAVGPLGKPGAQITVTSMMWLLPGQPVAGDGWLLEFPGLVVEPTWTSQGNGLRIDAKVTLMCGCPIEPGGHWDAAKYDVRATLLDGDKTVAATKLSYAGKPSTFAGDLPKPKAGAYRLLVTATNADTGNTGVVEQSLSLAR